MLIVALFLTAQKLKEPKSSLTDEWINKMWSIVTKKRKKELIYTTTWMDLKNYAK